MEVSKETHQHPVGFKVLNRDKTPCGDDEDEEFEENKSEQVMKMELQKLKAKKTFEAIKIEDLKQEIEEQKYTSESLKKVGIFAAKTALLSGGVIGGISIALPLAGFTASGVARGSLASGFQSTLGGYVAPGSAFAVCQRLGVKGLSGTSQAIVVATSAALLKVQSTVSNLCGMG